MTGAAPEVGDQLEGWMRGPGPKTLGSLIERFGEKSFAVVFGALAGAGSIAAFLAPPFSGLDTLPALGVVFLSLGVLLEDAAVVLLGLVAGMAGIALEIVLGAAALHGLRSLL